MNLPLLNVTSFYHFEMRPNLLYQERLQESSKNTKRNLKISNFTLTDIGFNYLSFQLNFEKPTDISNGGIGFEDLLVFKI